jgi:hypothetical protein
MRKILGYLLMFGGIFISILAIYLDVLLLRQGTSVALFIAYLVLYVGAGVFFFLLGQRLAK